MVSVSENRTTANKKKVKTVINYRFVSKTALSKDTFVLDSELNNLKRPINRHMLRKRNNKVL